MSGGRTHEAFLRLGGGAVREIVAHRMRLAEPGKVACQGIGRVRAMVVDCLDEYEWDAHIMARFGRSLALAPVPAYPHGMVRFSWRICCCVQAMISFCSSLM